MSPSDLSDVSGYTFLVNGRSSEGNWTGIFQPGERVRLRFVNASAMTIYDVRIPGLRMTVVQADGQNVEPVTVDEFRFGVAETYDVIVEPKDDRAYTIAAESIDRSGFALATLAPREGMRGETPEPRKRTLLTMADMGMGHSEHGGTSMEHGAMNHSMHMKGDAAAIASGWADAGTPAGDKALRYADLRALSPQREPQQPAREVEIRLGGNMERYIWTINGKRHQDSGPIVLKYGEKIRLKYINDTMMAHPMHLHGMFVQLENGQTRERLPNKHTVIIPPGTTYSVFLIVDEPGEWAFHCHLLYHMLSGMMTTVIVPEQSASPREIGELDGHHGH
jgi:FtsP/CotA-like multicopper oxidase with cupredoxin domain